METVYVDVFGEQLTEVEIDASPAIARAEERPDVLAGLRLFVVDDDPTYGRLLKQTAESLGATLDVFDGDHDFSRLPLDGDYDAAIIDYNLSHLLGTQVASLYFETPVILMSASPPVDEAGDHWPSSIKTFVPKRKGVKALVEAGLRLAAAPTTYRQ